MVSQKETTDDSRALQAVAAAVHVAVTQDRDHPDGGDDPVSAVTDEAALRRYVERYLDGYAVTSESLTNAIAEGAALTERTLKELISQAPAAGMTVEEFFEGGEFDIEAGLEAAASYGPDAAPREPSIRDRVLAALLAPAGGRPWLFVPPSETIGTGSNPSALAKIAEGLIESRGMPEDTSFAGWGWGYDHLRPDGSIKKGEDRQDVFWGGDREFVAAMLRRAEPLGFVVEGGIDGGRFRLVPLADASSPEPYRSPQRDDLLTTREGAEPAEFRYATTWVEKSHRPKSDDDWLSDGAAAELFETGAAVDLYVVPRTADDAIPPWSIKLRPRKTAVVTHYHRPSGSAARIVQLRFSPVLTNGEPRGSLVREKVSDHLWPADHAKYAPKTRAARTVVLTDGGNEASTIEQHDRRTGETTVTRHRDVPVRLRWMPYPRFGAWAPLIDPWFGTGPE